MQEENSRPWIKIAICFIIVGFAAGKAFIFFKHNQEQQAAMENVPAAEWASRPTEEWPPVVLLQQASFKNHTPLEAGMASFVELPSGEVVLLTAGHLLGKDGGVRPGFLSALGTLSRTKLAQFDSELEAWTVYTPDDPDATLRVNGLFGSASQYDIDGDQVLLRCAGVKSFGVTPLRVRFTPTVIGEPLFVFGVRSDGEQVKQTVHKATRSAVGMGFTCSLEEPLDMNGFSGAPVVDTKGRLVAIVTGGTFEPPEFDGRFRSFSGRELRKLLPVVKKNAPWPKSTDT